MGQGAGAADPPAGRVAADPVIVLHARALLCAALAEPRSEWVVTQVVHDEVAAPSHQPTWVLKALLTMAGRELDDGELDEAVTTVLSLPQDLHPPDPGMVARARELTAAMSFLDGLHVALAERLGVPMVTSEDWPPGSGDTEADAGRCQVLTPPAWLFPGDGAAAPHP